MKAIEKYVSGYTDNMDNHKQAVKVLNKGLRIMETMFLAMCYNHFTMMQLHRSLCINKSSSYEEAEKSADLFNAIFDLDIRPKDVMHDCDDMANKSIKDYNLFIGYMDAMHTLGYEKEAVIAFCRQLEYSYIKGLAWFRTQCNTHYEIYINALFSYLNGDISYETLEHEFVEISIFTKTVRPLDRRGVIRFIKDMIRVHDVFHEIVDKRKQRAKNKEA